MNLQHFSGFQFFKKEVPYEAMTYSRTNTSGCKYKVSRLK